MDWTREDFEAFFADSANKAGFADAWNFLSQVGNKHVAGTAISSDDSMEVLQTQFDNMYTNGTLSGTAFPCEGIDFSGKYICDLDLSNFTGVVANQLLKATQITNSILPSIDFSNADLSNWIFDGVDFSTCTGISASQLLSVNSFRDVKLPHIDFTGADLSKVGLMGVDLSKCTGLTVNQVLSAYSLDGAILPKIDFSGINLSGKYLSGVDFSQCVGLTGTQLASAADISNIKLSSPQYETVKYNLPRGLHLYVDGVSTVVPNRFDTGGTN